MENQHETRINAKTLQFLISPTPVRHGGTEQTRSSISQERRVRAKKKTRMTPWSTRESFRSRFEIQDSRFSSLQLGLDEARRIWGGSSIHSAFLSRRTWQIEPNPHSIYGISASTKSTVGTTHHDQPSFLVVTISGDGNQSHLTYCVHGTPSTPRAVVTRYSTRGVLNQGSPPPVNKQHLLCQKNERAGRCEWTFQHNLPLVWPIYSRRPIVKLERLSLNPIDKGEDVCVCDVYVHRQQVSLQLDHQPRLVKTRYF